MVCFGTLSTTEYFFDIVIIIKLTAYAFPEHIVRYSIQA
jgi:hypothetical protein